MDKIEKLYQNYDILANAKENIGQHEETYIEILQSVKGSNKEKRLASQLIARFFKDFPNLSERAIDAQLDLCEDEDVAIRKQAIKDLPSFCKNSKFYIVRIADILAQLLQTDDPTELNIIHSSLMTLFQLDAKATLGGLFAQIVSGDDLVREKALKFLCNKIKTLGSDILTREVEEYILQRSKKVFQDVTGTEFVAVIGMLTNLKVVKTVKGQQALVDLATEIAVLQKNFEHSDTESIDRLMMCIRQAIPYFSHFVSSDAFMHYMCIQVLPVLTEIPTVHEGVDIVLEMLKLLAEISPYASNMEDGEACLDVVYKRLLEYMPLPPLDDNTKNSSQSEEPTLQLSYVECLIYAFHQLAKIYPDFLSSPENAERLKDLKLRLQFLAQGIQGYIKKLREALAGKKGDELKTDENKLKFTALRTTSNINSIIKDLFHNPPSYKTTLTLSWKPSNSSNTTPAVTKRKEISTVTFDEPKAKKGSRERELYSPPSGKYSTKVKNFQVPQSDTRGGGRRFGQSGRGRGQRFY